jgi:prepilin-type N-terminal cleavage/methylation domain-containing protein
VSASTKDLLSRQGFSLLELLVVLSIISVALVFLIPALSSNSGRAVEGDVKNFGAHLEYARSYAISKRTKTRVLIAATNDWGTDFSWRAYVVASLDSTNGNWLQQGKFIRLSQSTTFDSATGIVAARRTTVTSLVKTPNATPTPAPSPFAGAYVEFSPTGSTSLDPSATPEVVRVQDGFVPSSGTAPTPIRKNQLLHADLIIDPGSGGMIAQ